MRSSVLVGAVLALLSAAPAQAAPELTLTAAHARDPLLRAQAPNTTLHPAVLTLRVANTGADPTDGSAVTVTETLPAGLSALVNHPGAGAGPVAASGPGWTCTGTARRAAAPAATRSPPGPPTRRSRSRSPSAAPPRPRCAAQRRSRAAVTSTAPAPHDDVRVVADACPNGWATSALNPERADGCSLLDLVWAAEPFADQAAFEAQVRDGRGAVRGRRPGCGDRGHPRAHRPAPTTRARTGSP